jgi:hypothetical protein
MIRMMDALALDETEPPIRCWWRARYPLMANDADAWS